MASAKDTPRQKMIGMMYLVLTALLALNVSKDILDAFVIVNKGLENSNENFTERNDKLYADFELAKSIDPVKVTPNWKLAQIIKKESSELVNYIDGIQKKLVAETEKVTATVADTLQMQNIDNKDRYDTPTNIMIGDSEDGSKGASRELKTKLVGYRSLLTSDILPADRTKVKVDINTDDPKYSEDNENWELYNFYDRPLVASLTILSKLKNDVKNAESLVVDYLLKQNEVDQMKFDTIAAKVIPQSNYVMLGEEYKSDIFIAAFSKTKKPEIMVGNYNEATKTFDGASTQLDVQNGLGKYTAATTREGIYDYSGTIKLKSSTGKEVTFPFKSEYIVAKPMLTVSADNMNAVYIGLDNPISVSVPGIPTERLSVSVTNGTLVSTGKGKYNMRVTQGTKAEVHVTATMESGEKKDMGTISFRIKHIPTPVAKIGNITTNGSMSKGEFSSLMGIVSNYENFDFKATCKVISYDMTSIVGGVATTKEVKGNTIDETLKAMFNRLHRNDRVFFENIKGIGPDGVVVHLSPVTIKVN